MKREAPVNLPASRPVALTAEFAERPDVQTRWGAFLQRNRLAVGKCPFPMVIADLSDFLMPILTAFRRTRRSGLCIASRLSRSGRCVVRSCAYNVGPQPLTTTEPPRRYPS